MAMLYIGLYLLSSLVSPLTACWGGYYDNEDPEKGKLDPSNTAIWSGWEAPPGAKGAWTEWLDQYNKTQSGKGQAHDPELHGGKPYGHDIQGWPEDWKGLGPPLHGMFPPPWAFVPKNMGKPSYCFLPPIAGNCTEKLERYGYNGFMDECQFFVYSGCGGNRNNFKKLEACQKACMSNPQSGCDNDSKLPIEDYTWSRRCGYSDDEPNDYVEIRNY